MKKKLIIILTSIIVLVGLSYVCYEYIYKPLTSTETSSEEELYICPMHPHIQQDHPGVCPICNMELVLKNSGQTMEDDGQRQEEVNIEIGEIMISPSEQVLANVKTMKVNYQPFDFTLEANGVVKARDDAYRQISSPVGGKIMRQFIRYEGQFVSKGQRAFEIYSPELVATQKEYLIAYDNLKNLKYTNYSRVYESAESILDATRERLKLWFITDGQIEHLEETRSVRNSLTYYADYSGVVTKKYINEGSWVTEGMSLFDVVNLGSVWVIANVYEYEMKDVRIGQSVTIKLSGYGDRDITGRIDYINPFINPDTRTVEVRITTSNPGLIMKPEMYVKVIIKTDHISDYIVVPRNSVLRTGKDDLVYIRKSKNVFQPRSVTIGGEREGNYLITSGLEIGDEIVTSAGFLLDSESQIRKGGSTQHVHETQKGDDKEPKINKDQDVFKDMEHK